MSKRLEKMRQNPKNDWTITDIVAVCREYDILCEPSRGGSSHYKVGHQKLSQKLTIPYKKPIKPVYIKMIVDFIDELRKIS